MILWRIAKAAYGDLSGEGARLHGGRWNSAGRAVVYLAEHPALALLEVLVHLDLTPELLPDDYVLMEVEAPDGAIPAAPAHRPMREAGDLWLQAAKAAFLRVPSALVPRSHNWLLNPAHEDAAHVRIKGTEPLAFDPRLA